MAIGGGGNRHIRRIFLLLLLLFNPYTIYIYIYNISLH